MPLKKSGGPIVGLDIGSTFIKACEIESKGGRANLRGIAVLPTPAEAVANNEIIDPVALGKAIKQLLNQSGIKAKRVVSCVAGQSALVVRIIEVPKMTRAELQETMKWEIERHVPFAAEQVVMDYQPLVPPEDVPDGQNMEVLLAVAQESLVNRHVEAIQAAGLQPAAIDIEALATSRALIDLSNGSGPQGTVAIVDLGASTTDVSIYREGRIAFTRSIQIAGNTLTKAISDVLGQPLAEAERLKKEKATVVEPQPVQPGSDSMFAAPQELDFGLGGDALGGLPLGGTFGMAPSTGESTATDTHAEPTFDIAGGGMSPDLFTTPTEGTEAAPAPAPEASPFDLSGVSTPPAAAAPEFSLGGPVPMGNPFDPDAGPAAPAPQPAAPEPAASPFGASPFGDSPFGPVPGADPFAPVQDLSALGGGSLAPAPDPFAAGAVPAAMSEEEYLRTQISDAIMPMLHELVTELRRSLEFFRNRANGLGAQQVMICGGTAKLPGLVNFLAANLEVPVVMGNPLEHVSAGAKSDPKYLEDVGPFFPVSVGLAVRELLVDNTPPRAKKKK